MTLVFPLICGLLLDWIFGEPKRYHPLVGFGYCANQIEKHLNTGNDLARFVKGSLGWGLLVLPIPLCLVYLLNYVPLSQTAMFVIDSIIIYWALGHKSLNEHGLQIYRALASGDLSLARKYCGFIVSRETSQLSEQEICRATTESMLENGHDAVTATLIWYIIGGAPLVIIHRLANTLDAMWGYRNSRYNYFGRFSARADDMLGFISAKATCVLFSILGLFVGKSKLILTLAFKQAKRYKSHNGGWVISAGATLINVELGGQSTYQGMFVNSPTLGAGNPPQSEHIIASLHQVRNAILLLVAIIFTMLYLWQLIPTNAI